jgi:hypothetical protein
MKSKIILLSIVVLSIATPTFASWSVLYDNGGGSAWINSNGTYYLLLNAGDPTWSDQQGNSGQAAVDYAWALDPLPSTLPTITNFANPHGLDWHCPGWSQFPGGSCGGGGGGTTTPLFLNSVFQYLTASSTCEQTNTTGTTTFACQATSTFPFYPGYGDWVVMESLILFCVAFIPIGTFYSMFTLRKKSKK